MGRKRVLILIFAILTATTIMKPALCMAQPQPAISDKLAIRAIVGEASNQGYRGMLAVSCAIRNRGSLDGVRGLTARHVNREHDYIWVIAYLAWRRSQYVDIVNGGTGWESVDFITPSWFIGKTVTARIGKHVFYVPSRQIRLAEEFRDEDGKRWREDGSGNLYNENGDRLYKVREG